MSPIRGGYSAFSSGPISDTTPKEQGSCNIGISDSMMSSSYGPPYGAGDSDFTKLEHKLAGEPGVTDPAALAAKIGREKIGQAEMTRRSVAAREK